MKVYEIPSEYTERVKPESGRGPILISHGKDYQMKSQRTKCRTRRKLCVEKQKWEVVSKNGVDRLMTTVSKAIIIVKTDLNLMRHETLH